MDGFGDSGSAFLEISGMPFCFSLLIIIDATVFLDLAESANVRIGLRDYANEKVHT